MKLNIIFISIFLSLVYNFKPLTADAFVEKCAWNEKNGVLEYSLTGSAIVKIRAGSPQGPVYYTLVNLEERNKGLHKEVWNFKDSSDKISFINYQPFHFCIDTAPRLIQDTQLITIVKHSPELLNPRIVPIRGDKPLTIILDFPSSIKNDFVSQPTELRIFIDNQLVRKEEPKTYPYTLELNLNNLFQGSHLITINCFQKIQGGACGYSNILVRKMIPLKANLTGQDMPCISYSTYIDGFWQICAMNLNNLTQFNITNSPADKNHPSFSPLGKKLAYVTNTGELWITDIEKGKSTKIPLPIKCAEPTFSPDGTKILFTSYTDLYHSNTELWLIELKTNQLTKLLNRPWLQYQPNWSPDGKYIIFVDGPELYGQEIRKLDIQTGEITQLTDNGPYCYDLYPFYNTYGEKIFYCSNQSGDYDIWVMDKYGRVPVNLTNHPAHDIMPVSYGKYIYFLTDRNVTLQIWRMDLDGKNPMQITNDKNDIRDISIYIQKKGDREK